jgi:hypothetical protein
MLSKPVVTIVLLPALVLGATPSFKAYKNANCTQELKLTSGNETIPNGELLVDTSIKKWESKNGPAGHWYNKMGYVGAQRAGTTEGTGANNVYWKVPAADPTCTFVLMRQIHGPDEVCRIIP